MLGGHSQSHPQRDPIGHCGTWCLRHPPHAAVPGPLRQRYYRAPDCVTVNIWPPTVIQPVKAVVFVFAATL
jgi:hypothetical protein